jgi:aryl-alcohol dehydrogenase-like predicted oxidoreductase
MEYRTLGNTGLRVSVLAFGGAEIGFEGASHDEVDAIVASALQTGVNVFDTAECYVDSEEKLGRALAGRRDQALIFTKCGHASGLEGADWDPAMLARSIDRSLTHLRTDYVDLIQLHSCSADLLRQGDVIDVLRRAREAGKARFVGYSGDAADALAAVRTGAFDTLQTSLNIADQQAADLTIPEASDRGMGVIAKRSIANAAWKYSDVPSNEYHHEYWRRLRELDYEFLGGDLRRAVSVALRFTLANRGVSTAIVGTKNPGRWLENSRMIDDGPLEPHLFESIRAVWREKSRPEWVGQV